MDTGCLKDTELYIELLSTEQTHPYTLTFNPEFVRSEDFLITFWKHHRNLGFSEAFIIQYIEQYLRDPRDKNWYKVKIAPISLLITWEEFCTLFIERHPASTLIERRGRIPLTKLTINLMWNGNR